MHGSGANAGVPAQNTRMQLARILLRENMRFEMLHALHAMPMGHNLLDWRSLMVQFLRPK
jgi:hypothetical protein